MTLAALSPLYTWWLYFFALLVFLVKVGCPIYVRDRQRLPDPLQLATWPPPGATYGATFSVTQGFFTYDDTLIDPWGPPNPSTRRAI